MASRTYVLRIFLFVMMVVMGVNAWGQTGTDYSGVYYIASDYQSSGTTNRNYNPTTLTNNFYLCPTENWISYTADSPNWETGDAMPFLTTYKARAHNDYDITKAKWTIEYYTTVNGIDYYYFKHSSGKYMVLNNSISAVIGNNNATMRLRVHLETLTPQQLDVEDTRNMALFSISQDGRSIVIRPKTLQNYQLTVNNGNGDYLQGNGTSKGYIQDGSTKYGTNGTIAIFNSSNDDSRFLYLEDYITRPTITYNEANDEITITPVQSGATLIYTTDGSTPSTTNPNATTIEGTAGNTTSVTFNPADGATTIKAVAVVNNELSNIAKFTTPVFFGSNHEYLIQSQNNGWTIDENTTDFHFYMIPGDEDNSVIKVNTTSLFRPTMEWYFLNAGVENDVQYYYIVNNSAKDNSNNPYYLCYDATNNVYMETYSEDNKFKFSIVESASTGAYFIKPYGQNNNLNKDSNNSSNKVINLNSTTGENARWKFIASSTLDRTAPFTASVPASNSYSYYKIASVGSSGHYIIPGTTNAITSNSDASDDMNWYFEVAQAADASDWLTYYHIRNAVTGDYLYFTRDANNAGACLAKSNTITAGSEDRYKFTWAKTADANVNYYIIPKLLKDASQNNFSSLRKNDNNTNIITNLTRGAANYAWTFASSAYICAQPEITWSADDNGYVITASESDAVIYYMIGEGELTPSSGTLYTSAIPVAELSGTTATIRAIAARNSDDSDASTVASVTVSKVETPTIILSDGTVQISSATAGASIYYEIGNTADGVSTPTSSSTPYSVPIENAEGKYIKAIAVKGGLINSAVAASSQILFPCATPVIRKASATTFTIECSFPTSGVTIYYTKGANPADPTTSSNQYEGAVTFNISELPFTVKAIAVASNYENSEIATLEITEGLTLDDDDYYIIASDDDFKKFITMANGAEPDKNYKITDDIDATGTSAVSTAFTGELMGVAKADGTFPVISNLGHPIFNTINGGTVKNIMLNKVSISQAGNVGAIAGVASGYTRIYNCGILPTNATNSSPSTVASTDGYCGGLVGWLKDDSRVINCFSYANITGGTDVAGIVGHNEIASTTEVTDGKYANLRTAVVNCMFYGDITGGSNRYPVYGGEKIVNNTATGINNYDFYRAEASLGLADDNHYNCSWPAKEEYLTKYEFYRNLLNSNRELCGWWVGAPSAPSTMTTTEVQDVPKDASLMAKWVLDTSVAPYPVLKSFGKYASRINIDANASWRESANEWEGKKLGTLKVTINPGDHAASGVSSTLPTDFAITDMDTLRADYCYRKIQLPYYNTVFGNPDGADWAAKYGGNYGDYVVIGWKVSTSEGTEGVFTENWQTGYNFADRKCTAKDANRIFAQGGYYYVPDGVENITITAQWASAIYLGNTDRYYDCVSVSSYTSTKVDNVNVNVGAVSVSPFAPAGTRSTTLGNGKTIQTGSISSMMPNNGSVYGNAIVLIGNHQEFVGGADIGSATKGGTVMSADLDFDDEPDYCLIWELGTKVQRQSICPIRFDFLPIVEMGLAMKEDGSTQYYSLGCYRPYGHFEMTETSLIHFGQFEFSRRGRTTYAPIILNGGIFDQYTKGHQSYAFETEDDKIDYVIIGGNVRMPSFTPGAHVNTAAAYPTRHCAVNVLGGNIDYLYLTGNYNEGVTPNTDNPHCYIDGGRLKQVAAAGKEGIDGDVYFKINHSKIWEFYGGSTMDQSTGSNFKIVKGNIDVTIDNSIVDKYCGGPKFGDTDYANNKTIKTSATGTTFGVYYGGGNGGTSYVQLTTGKDDGERIVPYNFKISGYNPGNYVDASAGYMADYDMEIVNLSTGTNSGTAVYRSYFYAAQFSATNTGSITNHLTDCKVLTNFYGGGNLGGVKGSVTSTLDGTTHVYGSAFGAGFSATVPDVTIHNKNKVAPTINVYTGIITPQSGGTSTTYTWTHETSLGGNTLSTSNPTALNVGGKNYFYTEESLENLGTISGNVELTIKGNTIVEGKVFKEDGTIDDTKIGGVFGGGAHSAVSGNTTVNLQGNTEVFGNVYGGGDNGDVEGSTQVNIEE